MIKRQLLATVSCLALTGVASAADLPARMPVKAPAPVVVTQLWAGPYIGINGGVVWQRVSTTTTNVGNPYDTDRLTASGATFGGQVGYNWQSQNFVYGLEGDLNWVDVDKSRAKAPLVGVVYVNKLNWLATARARAGVAFGRTMLFATGGLAVGGVDGGWHFLGQGCCLVSNKETRLGWTAGGGIEHFITNPHVTVKAEVLYVDLGTSTGTSPTGNYRSRFRTTDVIGRLGLNLKW